MVTGLTATDPLGRTVFTAGFAIDTLTYLRDPGLIEPLFADACGAGGSPSPDPQAIDGSGFHERTLR